MDTQTTRIRSIYDRMAPKYDRQVAFWERRLFKDGRAWACERARGQTLEIAVGTGRNLPFYPDGVGVVGIDVSPAMLELAQERAREIGRDVDLRLGDAQALPFPDEHYDTVVCTLSLCTIPDDRQAVAEMWRVLRPGGRLVLLEHVRSPRRAIGLAQGALELLTRRLGGDHLTREPHRLVEARGFGVECRIRSKWGIVERLLARKGAEG